MPEVSREKLYVEIGRRLRNARQSRQPKVTQDALAKGLGVERTSLTNIENGTQRATLHFLYRVAQHLDLPLTQLLPAVDDPGIQAGLVTELAELDLDQGKVRVPSVVKDMYDNIK